MHKTIYLNLLICPKNSVKFVDNAKNNFWFINVLTNVTECDKIVKVRFARIQ